MPHGLTKFEAQTLINKARSAIELLHQVPDEDHVDMSREATQEALQAVLENQIQIAETLDLVKKEFDKFEEGLGKIL